MGAAGITDPHLHHHPPLASLFHHHHPHTNILHYCPLSTTPHCSPPPLASLFHHYPQLTTIPPPPTTTGLTIPPPNSIGYHPSTVPRYRPLSTIPHCSTPSSTPFIYHQQWQQQRVQQASLFPNNTIHHWPHYSSTNLHPPISSTSARNPSLFPHHHCSISPPSSTQAVAAAAGASDKDLHTPVYIIPAPSLTVHNPPLLPTDFCSLLLPPLPLLSIILSPSYPL